MKSFVGVLLLVGTAAAQPVAQPQPQPQSQPQPQPQPQVQPQPQPLPPVVPGAQQAPWYRFTLVDGRVIDVQIVGGDNANYHVRTGGALYSIPRAQVAQSIPLAQPMVYAPPPPPVAQPVSEDKEKDRIGRKAGWFYFGSAYVLTAAIALAKRDNDSDASAGLIPIIGPVIWAGVNDDDDFFEDGWDWLAGFDMLIQGAGVYLILTGGDNKTNTNAVTLSPLSRQGAHGVVLSGSF